MAAASGSRNKIYAGGVFGFLAILSLLYYLSAPVYIYIVVYMWFGFMYGILQQYGRFCFASAWRDLIMIKVPRMFVGIMIGLMTLSIIASFIFIAYPEQQHLHLFGAHVLLGGLIFGLGMVLAGGCATGSLYKTGEGNMISLVVLLALSFSQAIFAATLLDWVQVNFIDRFSWSKTSISTMIFGEKDPDQAYSLFQYLVSDAFINAIVVGMILLIGVYILVVRKGFLKKRAKEIAAAAPATADGGQARLGFKDELAGFWNMISSSRRTSIAAVLIGIVAAAQIFALKTLADEYDFNNFGQVMTGIPGTTAEAKEQSTADNTAPPASWNFSEKKPNEVSSTGRMFDPQYWYITTQEAMFAGWTLDFIPGVDMKKNLLNVPSDMPENTYFGRDNGLPKPWLSPAFMLSMGLILGASFLALIKREFKWKFPNDKEKFLYALIGGTIMGIGARLALGCNIGAFYAPAAFGDPSGWLFFIGMGGGAFISAKFVNWMTERKMAKIDFDIEL